MPKENKTSSIQDSFLDALHSEIISGSENLTAWIKQVQTHGAIESLFGLETWLKGIRSFFSIQHLPLGDGERNELVTRNFAPEIAIVHKAIQSCESCACMVVKPDIHDKLEFEDFIAIQMRRHRMLDFSVSRMVEQLSPRDSVSQLLESLNDLRITMDAFKAQPVLYYQLFLSLGRSYRRELKNCRYIDMLMSQRFKLQYDLIDNKSLTSLLRKVTEESVRRDMALALLYLFRFLKYLKIISADLVQDRPLKQHLVIFSLLHEEMENLSDFLKSRFLKNKDVGPSLRNAAELIGYSLKMESQRVLNRELLFVSRENDPAMVYTRIENSHGLLSNCCQSSVMALLQSIDKTFDGSAIFPARAEGLVVAEKVRQDLWDLRKWLMDVLSNKETLDSDKIILRITVFKEASLRSLMFRDWAEFDAFLDAVAISNSFIETRTHIRKFVGFLETLIQEVSKRSVFREKPAAS